MNDAEQANSQVQTRQSRWDAALRGATILLGQCLGLASDDRFLIVYDETTLRLPKLFVEAGRALRVEVVSQFISRARQIDRKAFNADLEQQMDQVEGILLAVTADPEADGFRIDMADRHRGAATVASFPGASVELLATALDVNYQEIASMCRHLTIPLLQGDGCRVTTYDRQGKAYVLGMSLGRHRRVPVQSLGIIVPRGGWGNPCGGETFIAPIEGTAEGEYLVNGAVGPERVLGRREALLTFRQGRLVSHRHLEGGTPVAHLTRLATIARRKNVLETWNVLAELGIGVNRAIRRIVGIEVIDEKKYGTVHIAIGHNETFGGQNRCHPIHCDITTQHPTVTVDGHVIIERGDHVADHSPFLEDHRQAVVPPAKRQEITFGDIWRLSEHFEVDAARRLWVLRRTPSGRSTVYQPFIERTAALAAALVLSDISSTGDGSQVFCDEHGIALDEFYQLLYLLELHHVIALSLHD